MELIQLTIYYGCVQKFNKMIDTDKDVTWWRFPMVEQLYTLNAWLDFQVESNHQTNPVCKFPNNNRIFVLTLRQG